MITRDDILDIIYDLYKQNFKDANIDFDKVNLETNLLLTQAILDENLLNYLSLMANESILTTAVLPETIYQFASTFGYEPKYAIPGYAMVDFYIPIESSGSLIPQLKTAIDFNTKFQYNDITYRSCKKIFVDYVRDTNTISVIAYDINGNKYVLPVFIDMLKVNNENLTCIRFSSDIIQSEQKIFTFSVTQDDISNYKFPTFFISDDEINSGSYNLSDFKVYVSGQPAIKVTQLYELPDDVYAYVLIKTNTGYKFVFGNGYVGKALKVGDYITIESNLTLGVDGNVPADSLELATPIYNTLTKQSLKLYIKHSDITNGKNPESLIEIKRNIIKKISTNDRLVSIEDFKHISDFIDFGTNDIYCVYSKSDLQKNEIDIYGAFSYNDNYVKTSSLYIKNYVEYNIPQNKLIYEDINGNFYIDSKPKNIKRIWVVPFEIQIEDGIFYPHTYYIINNPFIPSRTIIEKYYSIDNQSYINLNKTSTFYLYSDLIYDYILDNKYDTDTLNYDALNDSKIVMRFDLLVNVAELNISYDDNGFVDKTTITNNFDFEINLYSKSDNKKITTENIYEFKYDQSSNTLSLFVVFDNNGTDYIYPEQYQGNISVKYSFTGYDKEEILYSDLQPFYFKMDLTDYSPVKIVPKFDNNNNIIFDYYNIPIILLDDWLNNDIECSDMLRQFFGTSSELSNKLMLTLKANLTLPKTCGLIINTKYTDFSVFNNAVNPETDKVSLPLKLKIYVYVQSTEDLTFLKEKLLYAIKTIFDSNYKGYQKSVVLNKLESDIYKELQNESIHKLDIYLIDDNGNELKKDIIYDYDPNTYEFENSEDLLTFTPEFISLDYNNLDIEFKLI